MMSNPALTPSERTVTTTSMEWCLEHRLSIPQPGEHWQLGLQSCCPGQEPGCRVSKIFRCAKVHTLVSGMFRNATQAECQLFQWALAGLFCLLVCFKSPWVICYTVLLVSIIGNMSLIDQGNILRVAKCLRNKSLIFKTFSQFAV